MGEEPTTLPIILSIMEQDWVYAFFMPISLEQLRPKIVFCFLGNKLSHCYNILSFNNVVLLKEKYIFVDEPC